ncbi:hypothetical protein [Geothrix sp. 21YS21S-4]|uniref:hypothetical protein n=1 Tax=Geothrix sp. 21YS21S-4 TaxID=3068889 RepID=UPI0027B9BCA5|nr:hypothetical protein [Geothrix sp. 21YS21S-4]
MFAFLMSEAAALGRVIQVVAASIILTVFAPLLRSAEPVLVSLKGFEAVEVRGQGFTLPRDAKVHVYAKGGGVRRITHRPSGEPLFAYGWILNAATREVVWQMDGANTSRNWEYRVADQYLDLPKGSYEAYFANHGFGQGLLFAQWSRNIDRRDLRLHEDRRRALSMFGLDDDSLLRHWREQVGNYGMEVYLPSGDPAEVPRFDAPLRWKNVVVSLPARADSGHWTQPFHLSRPTTLHVYAEGEGSGRRMHDYGWIIDARARTRVWEMTMDRSQYAGGASKNRRQVETVLLPAGDYEAAFATDDSHSPADWNAAPPCDPGMYGLTLSVQAEADLPAVSFTQPLSWTPLAELVRVGDGEDRRLAFRLPASRSVRVYALGEGDGDAMADEAWIEDAAGKRVWIMERSRTHHAGGAFKNRQVDEVIQLPKGEYVLRFRTDGSHAYGHWNSDAPWDAEHYGVTVYAGK